MSYTALYRKFRPGTFEDVKGQDHIVATLKNQIKADRIGHAYLFTGTRGTGKTTIAKIFAKAVNCENPVDGSPCGECETCRAIASGTSMNVIEIDAASNNGVDNIREIVEEVSYSPARGKFKVYIIDEVHMLSLGAFNALLKTLEEPPSYVIFILATTEVHKIPITILSRCQRYDFRRISIDTIADRLRELMITEQVQVEERALRYVAKTADGSMRDALSLMDQCIAFHFGSELTYDKVLDVLGAVDTGVFSKMLRFVLEGDVAGCIRGLEEIIVQGREMAQFVTDFTWYLRNLLLLKTSDAGEIENVMDISSDNLQRMKEEAQITDVDTIMRYIRVLSELTGQLRTTSQKRVLIEMTLIRLCKPQMETNTDALLDRIRVLEEKLEHGDFAMPTGITSPVQSAPPEKIERAELPKALPQEVKEVAARWYDIMDQIGQPLKTYLKSARLSVEGEGTLVMAVSDINAYDWINSPLHKEELLGAISNMMQRNVEIQIRGAESKREMDEKYPDLAAFIHMEIEEEDEEG